VNLAASLASRGKEVMLLDGDLGSPTSTCSSASRRG
jgi:Mrp family chromosome partitioning ATPase